jgi:transposase
LAERDFSPGPRGRYERPSVVDVHKEWIDAVLEANKGAWRRQRHTAQRLFDRLVAKRAFAGPYSAVQRYVKRWRPPDRLKHASGGFNDLAWEPRCAQVDFGEADFDEPVGRTRRSYLTVWSPCSNQGFAQVFGGETAECVCQGLLDVFAHSGGVLRVSVFDNAAGVAAAVRRLGCSNGSGWTTGSRPGSAPLLGPEKGNVENSSRKDYHRLT